MPPHWLAGAACPETAHNTHQYHTLCHNTHHQLVSRRCCTDLELHVILLVPVLMHLLHIVWELSFRNVISSCHWTEHIANTYIREYLKVFTDVRGVLKIIVIFVFLSTGHQLLHLHFLLLFLFPLPLFQALQRREGFRLHLH